MSEAYELETRAHCPQVTIVYDLFHVVAKFGREVIDRVRVDATNRIARASGRADQTRDRRRVIKGARWLLLRNKEHLPHQDRIRLKELLALNRHLWVVYVLKDDLKAIWHYKYTAVASRAWEAWYGWAIRSRIPPLVAFARKLKVKLPGILAHCRFPLHTGVLEGMNDKIKVLKRMAYGFRNDACFFLKIRAAFPGNPDEPYVGFRRPTQHRVLRVPKAGHCSRGVAAVNRPRSRRALYSYSRPSRTSSAIPLPQNRTCTLECTAVRRPQL